MELVMPRAKAIPNRVNAVLDFASNHVGVLKFNSTLYKVEKWGKQRGCCKASTSSMERPKKSGIIVKIRIFALVNAEYWLLWNWNNAWFTEATHVPQRNDVRVLWENYVISKRMKKTHITERMEVDYQSLPRCRGGNHYAGELRGIGGVTRFLSNDISEYRCQ